MLSFFLLSATALLLAALAMVLMSPVRLLLCAQSEPHFQLVVRASILGGLVPVISLFDSDHKKPNEKPKPKKKTTRQQHRKNVKPRLAWAGALPKLLVSLWQALTIEHAAVQAVFGLDDPADTGALFGRLTPWIYGLPPTMHAQLDLQPDFSRTRLTGNLDAAVRFTPIRLVPIVLRFGWDLLAFRGSKDADHSASHDEDR